MPPVGPVWNVDWLNANSQRKYPIFEEATLADTTGSFRIPNDFIVDLIWPVHADVSIDPTLFHLASISVFGTGVALSIGYNGTIIGSVAIDAGTFIRNSTLLIQGTGIFFDTVGRIVIGDIETVLNSAGVFIFDVTGARFEPTVIRPDLRGVQSVRIQNGDDISDAIQGDIIFEAGTNVLLQFIAGPGSEPDRIQINAIEGEGMNEECDCAEATTLPCIKTINGVGPDSGGDFDLLGDDCLKLNAVANGIQFVDECAKPCCGCDELNVVITTNKSVLNQVYALERLISQLEGNMQQLETNLLSSRTGIQK
jgi:hypothetical protein